jgi:hypothetical protein
VTGQASGITPARAVRVPDHIWDEALAEAKRRGTTVTAVVVAALDRFVHAAPYRGRAARGGEQMTTTATTFVLDWRRVRMGTDRCGTRRVDEWRLESPGYPDARLTVHNRIVGGAGDDDVVAYECHVTDGQHSGYYRRVDPRRVYVRDLEFSSENHAIWYLLGR